MFYPLLNKLQPRAAAPSISGRLLRARRSGAAPAAPGFLASVALPGSTVGGTVSVSHPSDHAEREADHVAERVMTMPAAASARGAALPRHASAGAPTHVQRKCGACANAEAGARAAPSGATLSSELGGGQALDADARAFAEPRFAYDFSAVRVHTNNRAHHLAHSLHARAFTYGSDVVFAEGEYQPSSAAGRRLLAHELTHVVQQTQGSGGSGALGIQRASVPSVQRLLTVSPTDTIPLPGGGSVPPQALTHAVQGLMTGMCPTGGASVDPSSGVASMSAGFCDWAGTPWQSHLRGADVSPTPAGCGCLCDVIGDARTTTVGFRAGGPSTGPGSTAGPGPGQGGVTTDATVSIDPRFRGQYRISGRWVDVPFHLLFAHELCGHALPKMLGTHVARGPGPAGGTPPQEVGAVAAERRIAAERGFPRRPDDYSGDARERP